MFALTFDTAVDPGTCVLPPGLDEMEPGPVLAGFLSAVDLEALSGYDRVVVLRAQQRMASHYQAQTYRAMAAISDTYDDMVGDDPEVAFTAAATEIRAALQLTRRAADSELGVALDLAERLPQVAGLLAGGEIDARRARTILYGTAHLDTEAARAVVDQIADQAPNLTTGQLAARIRRLCIEVDPDDAQRRYQDAVAERRVISEPTVDGTANLMGLDLPPDRVAAATNHLNRIARSLRGDGETRSMDQLRADVLLDLLCGTHTTTGAGNGVVDIHVDLTTLAELADHPGELAGYGPVIADIARHITRDQPTAEWRYTVTDPDTRHVLHTGTTRRRPSAAARRHIQTRTPTCVFPGCRMPATACDLDHRTPWAECRRTNPNDMAPFCRHDHGNRHRGWTYTILPNGTHHFTSPLGHTYTTPHKPP